MNNRTLVVIIVVVHSYPYPNCYPNLPRSPPQRRKDPAPPSAPTAQNSPGSRGPGAQAPVQLPMGYLFRFRLFSKDSILLYIYVYYIIYVLDIYIYTIDIHDTILHEQTHRMIAVYRT